MTDLRYEVDQQIATITLDRPQARNAYSDAMIQGIIDALDRADRDDSIRALIVTGAGTTFCAGGDLKQMRQREGMFAGDPVELREQYLRGLQSIPRRFERFEKPTIAAINGHAIGAGLDLTLMCDIRVASSAAKFGSTFASVGLIPGDGGAYLLPRVVGFARAVELILTARVFDAAEALKIGLVHHCVAPDDVIEQARTLALQIARLPPKAVRMAKAALYRSVDRDHETALQLTAALQACVQHTDQHEQAVEELLARLGPTR